MKHMVKRVSLFLLCILQAIVYSGIITHTLKFSSADFSIDRFEGYDVIRMKGAGGDHKTGNPDLPLVNNYFLIPPDAEIDKVEITDRATAELAGTYRVMPAQEACPISRPDLWRRTGPNMAVYSSSALYPEKILENSLSGSCCGFRIAGIIFSPLQYQPSEGRLFMTTGATITVHYREGARPSKTISERQYRAFLPLVRNLISNTQDIRRFSPQVRPDKITDVNYAIVTDDSFKSGFDALKLWKTKKGFRTEVFTTAWVYSNYTGYDNAEKIRNFFRDYHKNKGLVYALLAGDCDKVPQRIVEVKTSPGDAASDYYFGDLDSTWDTNNDHVYGEPRMDKVDGYFDIYPGRLPLDNLAQAGYFIHKDTTMEKRPPAACMKRFLLGSAVLCSTKHGKELNNMIADSSTAGWLDIKLEDPPRYAVRDSLNSGVYLAHINCHGQVYEFTNTSGSMLHSDDVGSLTAANNCFPILYSEACHVSEFDYASQDCIAELLINRQNGGCVATLLNSRLGWFSPTPGTHTGSDLLDLQFTSQFFRNDTVTIGQILAATKHVFREKAWGESYDVIMHYVVNELTLFGDPDLPFYREIPTQLSVTHPGSIGAGQQNFAVIVGANSPAAGALVCCYKEGEVHETGYTDASGQVSIAINPATSGVLYVTATAKNCLPYEGVCSVGPSAVQGGGDFPIARVMTIRQDNNGGLDIRFTILKPSEVRATLYDARGATVKVIRSGVRNPGVHTIRTSGIRAGVYMLNLYTAGYETKEKVIIVR